MPIDPPQQLLPWLVYIKSLTQKLHAITNSTHLEILNQQWKAPDRWDHEKLKIQTTSVLHREILMHATDTPCWYARTIIPDYTFQNNINLFERLKNEPLGHLIFNGTEIQRVSLEHYAILSTSTEYQWLNKTMHQGQSTLWMRLSEFTVHQQDSFFLAEILLPGLLRYIS